MNVTHPTSPTIRQQQVGVPFLPRQGSIQANYFSPMTVERIFSQPAMRQRWANARQTDHSRSLTWSRLTAHASINYRPSASLFHQKSHTWRITIHGLTLVLV